MASKALAKSSFSAGNFPKYSLGRRLPSGRRAPPARELARTRWVRTSKWQRSPLGNKIWFPRSVNGHLQPTKCMTERCFEHFSQALKSRRTETMTKRTRLESITKFLQRFHHLPLRILESNYRMMENKDLLVKISKWWATMQFRWEVSPSCQRDPIDSTIQNGTKIK